MRLLRSFRNISLFRPFRLYRRGRSVVNSFQTEERLYRRFRRADLQNGVLLPSALKFPNKGEDNGQSVNRSAFSRPEDVKWESKGRIAGAGVYGFPVSCLPALIECPDTHRRFTFSAKHVPLWNNYAHTEIWCDSVPTTGPTYVVPTRVVRKELRAQIQKCHRVFIEAEV